MIARVVTDIVRFCMGILSPEIHSPSGKPDYCNAPRQYEGRFLYFSH